MLDEPLAHRGVAVGGIGVVAHYEPLRADPLVGAAAGCYPDFFDPQVVGEGVVAAGAGQRGGGLGVWLGVRSAWKRGERFNRVATPTTLVLYSMPEFWIGMILLIVFSVGVFGIPGIFPVGGLSTPGVDVGTFAGLADRLASRAADLHPDRRLSHRVLVVMRASLIDEMCQDYLQTARAKGLRDADARRRHAVPNALLPTTTLIFLNLGFVICGAITIEQCSRCPVWVR